MRRFVLLLLLLLHTAANAHDPSAWGGLFRSRDDGANWLPVDAGLFIGGAMAIAISPADPNHLLYATDTRLLRSHNGGRDWVTEAAGTFIGPTLSVAFGPDGILAVASSSAGVFRTTNGKTWTRAQAPDGAAPARAIVAGHTAGLFYLNGPKGVFVSTDGGATWSFAASELPPVAATALVIGGESAALLAAVIDHVLWFSLDGGTRWTRVTGPWSGRGLASVGFTGAHHDQLIAVADDRVFHRIDNGGAWTRIGEPIGAGLDAVRSVVGSPNDKAIVVTTHRGMMRSADGGATWARLEGVLPIHLESAPLIHDPVDAHTLYAGFSLTPYGEVFRRAEEGSNVLSRIDPVSLAGGGAFLLLLLIGGTIGARRLARASRADKAANP